jgi:uncharacterized protein
MGWLSNLFGRTPRLDATEGALARYGRALYSAQSGIGGPKDRATTVFPVPMSELSDQDIDDLFRFSSFARRIILEPTADAIRAGWHVQGEGVDGETVDSALDALKAKSLIGEADWRSELRGGGALIAVTSEGGGEDLSQPINRSGLQSVDRLLVATRRELVPTQWEWEDLRSPHFGKPILYRWTPRNTGGVIVGATYTGGRMIHADRLHRFEGAPVPNSVLQRTQGWGDSRLQAVWGALRDYMSASANCSGIVETFTDVIFKIKGLAELLSRGPAGPDGLEGAADLEARMEALGIRRGNFRVMSMDADGESMEKLGAPVGGLADLIRILMVNLTSAADMPLTKLFGVAPPGLSTDDLSGARNWDRIVLSRQELRLEPAIRWLVTLVMQSKEGPTRGKVQDFEIAFNPLTPSTAKEQAEIDAINGTIVAEMIDTRQVTAEEARRARFSGTKEFAGLSLDVDHEPEPTTPTEGAHQPIPGRDRSAARHRAEEPGVPVKMPTPGTNGQAVPVIG